MHYTNFILLQIIYTHTHIYIYMLCINYYNIYAFVLYLDLLVYSCRVLRMQYSSLQAVHFLYIFDCIYIMSCVCNHAHSNAIVRCAAIFTRKEKILIKWSRTSRRARSHFTSENSAILRLC